MRPLNHFYRLSPLLCVMRLYLILNVNTIYQYHNLKWSDNSSTEKENVVSNIKSMSK